MMIRKEVSEQEIHQRINNIKKRLRLSMNGVVSAHQRKQGLNYKINFGVEVPRLKSIAEDFEKNRQLAQALWQENIRECKLLATFLMPADEFSPYIAEQWITQTQFTEIADHLVMNLLIHEEDAIDKALQRIEDGSEYAPYCGYLALSHLMRRGRMPNEEQENRYIRNIVELLGKQTGSKTLRSCAYTSLMTFISDNEDSKTEKLRNAAESAKAEAESIIYQLLNN